MLRGQFLKITSILYCISTISLFGFIISSFKLSFFKRKITIKTRMNQRILSEWENIDSFIFSCVFPQ